MSGSPNITQDAVAKRQQDAGIVSALGCGDKTDPAARAVCLRAIDASTVSRSTPHPWDTPGIFGWPSSGLPAPQARGMDYAGIVHVDGVIVTLPFDRALQEQTVDAAIIISNMDAEGDGGPGVVVRNFTQQQWEQAVKQAFATWPGGGDKEATIVLNA